MVSRVARFEIIFRSFSDISKENQSILLMRGLLRSLITYMTSPTTLGAHDAQASRGQLAHSGVLLKIKRKSIDSFYLRV